MSQAKTARHLEAREAELSVLGAILLDDEALNRVSAQLAADDFYGPRHRVVFAAMLALAERGEPIDPFTLSADLDRAGKLDAIGGLAYLLELAEASATAVNIEHHATIVHEAAEVRRLVDTCRSIVAKADGGDYEATAGLFEAAQQAIFEVASRRVVAGLVPVKPVLKGAIEKIQAAYTNKQAVTGTPSGFTQLDALTAGLHAGELMILAARPAMGKTAFALNLAVNAARLGGVSVAIFSLEMPAAQLAARLLAGEARVDGERIKTGMLESGDIDRLLQAVKVLGQLGLHIDETPALSVMDLRAKCRRLAADKSQPKLGLVVIDYLQLMRGSARSNRGNREQEISEISQSLKALAKDLRVPVLALAQLNRGVETRANKRPMLSDLRESGAIEQDADLVMFCYRDEYYHEASDNKERAEIIIGKHRNGATGTVTLRFLKQWTKFEDMGSDAWAGGGR